MDVPAIRQALAARMAHLTPDVNVYDVLPDNPQYPAAVVGINDLTFSSQPDRGLSMLIVPVTALAGGSDREERQRVIDRLISTEYPESLPPCFDRAKVPGEPWELIVLREGIGYRTELIGQNEAVAFDLLVEVRLPCD